MHRKIVNFNFKWIFENLNFWFSDHSDIGVTRWNWKKGPLSHQKMKCSFLDYVQFLMIGWVIWVTKVTKNVKIMAAKSFYCISGNFYCSDDSVDHQKLKVIQKQAFHVLVPHSWLGVCWNAPQPWMLHQKIKWSILDCLTSDDWLSNLSYKSHQKCENNGCQIILLHFWQLSLLRWLGQSSEVESNQKMNISCFGVTFMVGDMLKCPPTMNVAPKNKMLIFGLCLTSDGQPSNLSYKSCKNWKTMAAKSFYCISGNFHCSDDSANHQKLKVIQKWAFHVLVPHSWLGVCWNDPNHECCTKNKMLIFGLCLTSDGWPSNLSYKSHQKCENNGCQIILLHFWQLSLLRWLGQSSEVESNPKMSISCFGVMFMVGGMLKCPPTINIALKNKMLILGLCLTSDDQLSNLSYKSCQKCENNGCQVILLHFWQLLLLRWLSQSSEVIFKFSSVLIVA